MKFTPLRSLFCLACLALVSACGEGSVREKLGMERSAPDEFRVVSRPPLSVPPQFNLRPPAPGDESQARNPAHKQAESLLLGTSGSMDQDVIYHSNADTAVMPVSQSALGTTSAESQFLKNAGAERADPTVRTTLIEEKVTREQQVEEASWWQPFKSSTAEKEPMVNAQKESERIKENKKEGKPVTEGETPEVDGKDTGFLGHVFGY